MEMMNLASLKQFYKDKRVFITGHSGFKGAWLCEILNYLGAYVYGYSLRPEELSLFKLCGLESKTHTHFGDIRNAEELLDFYKQANPDIVLHLAAQPLVRLSYETPAYTYETNVMGTVNILECLRKHNGAKSFVNVTTDKVYCNKEWAWGYREYERLDGYDPYSNSKSCSELVTWTYKRCFFNDNESPVISTMRAGNVIGGGDFATDRIIPDCIRAAIEGKDILVRNPNSIRPYQHVLDPLFAYLLLAAGQYMNPTVAGAFNIGPDETDCLKTGDLVDAFVKTWGENVRWINGNPDGPHEANFLKLDNSLIKARLGWHPVWNIRETVDKIVEWTKSWQAGDNVSGVMKRQIEQFIIDSDKL